MVVFEGRRPYKRLNLSLATARTNQLIDMDGDFIIVESITGSANIKLQERSNNPIDLQIFQTIRSPFDRFYVTNTAQAGKSVVLLIGGAASFEAKSFSEQTLWWDGTAWQKWTGLEGESPYVSIFSRNATDWLVFDSVTVPASGVITHTGIDVSGLSQKMVMISTTNDCDVRIQYSHDNTDWYDLFDGSDSEVLFNVNNVKKCFGVTEPAHYMRVVVQNNHTSSITLTGHVMGVA